MSDRDRAIDLMRSGQYREALERFGPLLAAQPEDWSLHYMAGQCARFSNDIPSAVTYLARAADLNKAEPQVQLALGIAQQLQGQLLESQDSLRRALELDSEMESAYNSLGITQKKIGKLDAASHNFEEGLKALSRRIARTMHNVDKNRISHIRMFGETAGHNVRSMPLYTYARSNLTSTTLHGLQESRR